MSVFRAHYVRTVYVYISKPFWLQARPGGPQGPWLEPDAGPARRRRGAAGAGPWGGGMTLYDFETLIELEFLNSS